MAFLNKIFALCFVFVLINGVFSKPRDASLHNSDSKLIEDAKSSVVETKTVVQETVDNEVTTLAPAKEQRELPWHRVPCEFEEATEASVCQEHCLPKGYSYGLCVSFTCSCV